LSTSKSREQLIDLAIMDGTDFNKSNKGVGPKTAPGLIKTCGTLERLPPQYKDQLVESVNEVRSIFLDPGVLNDVKIQYSGVKKDESKQFLCGGRGFSKEGVDLAIGRMREFYARERSTLTAWLGKG
jgi:5'-3' exonuclease